MPSEVQLCSDALGQLGESPIMSLDPPDDSKRARLCARFYPDVRDAVLRAYPWRCAIEYQSLNRLSGSSAISGNQYAYTYQLPTDPFCLRALSINDDVSVKWERIGFKLLTDEESVTLRYIKRIVDPGEFDTLLFQAIVSALVQVLAYPVTGDKEMGITAWNLYEKKLAEARSIDSVEGSVEQITSDDLLSVR